jgi:hypothetical protein
MYTPYKNIRFRRDTAANFTSKDPILQEGEPGFETDTGLVKIGDGVTAWTSLDYIGVGYFVKADGTTNIQYSSGSQKIGNVSGGNYAEFEADGTLEFFGDATVFDDLRITPGSFDRPGVADPDYVLYNPNGGGLGVYLPEFALNDFASFTVQMPHGYHPEQSIYCHLHWTPGARGNEEATKKVGWKIDYSWANISANFGNMQTIDLSDVCDGTDHKHQMTDEVEISGTGKAISSMLLCTVKRTSTGTDDDWASTTSGQLPLLLEIDFHFPMNTIGSRLRSSK